MSTQSEIGPLILAIAKGQTPAIHGMMLIAAAYPRETQIALASLNVTEWRAPAPARAGRRARTGTSAKPAVAAKLSYKSRVKLPSAPASTEHRVTAANGRGKAPQRRRTTAAPAHQPAQAATA